MFRRSLAIIFLGIALTNAKPTKQPHKKVLILGAGLSGIVAGKTLKDNGIDDFLILEGQDYIGGRIKQVDVSGYKVEEGANFIHTIDDADTNPLWEKKKEFNMKGFSAKAENIIFRSDKGQNALNAASYTKLITAMSRISSKQEESSYKLISVRDGLKLLGWSPLTPFEYVLEWFFYDFSYAKEAENIAFMNIEGESGEDDGTPDFFITDPRGVFGLYTDLYEDFKSKIILNKTVNEIAYNSTSVEVTTDGGETYTADYALCTFSTGVLASDMVKFSPPLPDAKKEAIANMPLGTFTKIFVKFPKKFWDDKLYIALANNKRGYFPVIVNLDSPEAFPGSGLMLMIVTGEEAKKVEKQTLNETRSQIVEVLKGVYGQNISEPTDIHYARWTQNKYVRGAYSDMKVGSVLDTNVKNMQKNLENLYFSGEGTSGKWAGYMQGAYLTGQKQASAIVSAIRGHSLALRVEPLVSISVTIITLLWCMVNE